MNKYCNELFNKMVDIVVKASPLKQGDADLDSLKEIFLDDKKLLFTELSRFQELLGDKRWTIGDKLKKQGVDVELVKASCSLDQLELTAGQKTIAEAYKIADANSEEFRAYNYGIREKIRILGRLVSGGHFNGVDKENIPDLINQLLCSEGSRRSDSFDDLSQINFKGIDDTCPCLAFMQKEAPETSLEVDVAIRKIVHAIDVIVGIQTKALVFSRRLRKALIHR